MKSYCWSGSCFNRRFGQSSSPISHQFHLAVLPPPTLTPENCIGWVFTCAGCNHQQDVKWGRSCYTLASSQLGSIITSFPSGLRRVKHPPSIAPQLHTCPSNPPRDANTPWDAASRVRDGVSLNNHKEQFSKLHDIFKQYQYPLFIITILRQEISHNGNPVCCIFNRMELSLFSCLQVDQISRLFLVPISVPAFAVPVDLHNTQNLHQANKVRRG